MNVPEFSGFWQWLGWFLIAAAIGHIGRGTISIHKKDNE